MLGIHSFPLISVIIPTLNRPDMLIRAVRSVAQQTYPNLEIVIVDDGSHCNIQNLIEKEFASLVCRILRNPRSRGGSGARNAGFYESKGEYIAFLDDDDEWLPEKIHKQFQAFRKSDEKVGVVCTHSILIHGNVRTVRPRYLEGNVYHILCKEQLAGNTSNPLIKRSVFEEAGLFDERMPAAQDTDLWLRISKRCDFTTINEPLVLVYLHDSERITKNLHKQLIGNYFLMRKHWKDLHISRKYKIIKRSLRQILLLVREKMGITELNKK